MAQFTIAASASLSDTIDLGCTQTNERVVAIIMPAAWTAASMTFQRGISSSAMANVYDDAGNEVTLTVDASRHVVLDNDVSKNLTNVRFLAIRSGTSGSAVNQGAQRLIEVVTG